MDGAADKSTAQSMSWYDYFPSAEYIMALPLADRNRGVNRIIGTATFVLPGVFLTARHMLEHYTKEHENIDITSYNWIPHDLDGNFELDVIHMMKDNKLLVWHINKVHHIPNADLVVMIASGYTGEIDQGMRTRSAYAKIDLHFPPVGSRLSSIGYPMTQNEAQDGGTQTRHRLTMKIASGVVEDIDTGASNLFKSPRLQTNAEIDGGMSGGPCLNDAGVLFGLNGSAMPPTNEHNFYTSFITPLAMAMPVKINIQLDINEGLMTETTLIELAKKGYIEVIGLEHFIFNNEGGLQFNTRDIKCKDCPIP